MKKICTALLALAVAAACACGKKKDEPKSGGTAGSGQGAASGGAPSKDNGAATGPVHTAAGGEVSNTPTVTECPKSLDGSESVNRVITSQCGTVLVTGDYHLNNGTLTLEAGVTLAFKDRTSIHIGYNDTAKLIVKGTSALPVTFTSAGDRVPGVWNGLYLHEHADRSQVDHLIVEFAGTEDSDAVQIDAQDVVWTNSTVRGAKGDGLVLHARGTLAGFSGNAFEAIGKSSLALSPMAAGGLGTGNKFPDGATIRIDGGAVSHDVKWTNPGAPYWIESDVRVDGSGNRATLEVAGGAELRFAPDAHIDIGYSGAGALKVTGSKDKPALFTTITSEKKPGSWRGVRIYANGEASIEGARFEYAGTADDGAILVDHDGSASIKGCTFANNTIGVALRSNAKLKAFEKNSFSGHEKAALYLLAEHVAALGADNTYDAATKIVVDGGRVDANATWHAQGAPLEVGADIAVDGRIVLTVEAGTKLVMREGTKIEVGYSENASLRLLGTPDKPIQVVGERDEPGTWKGIILDGNSRDSVIQNVVFRDGPDTGGVRVDGQGNAKIENATCAKCAGPVVAWACDSKVTTANLKAAEGTPKAEGKPECGK